MTTLQKEMLNAVGHNVEVHAKGACKPICAIADREAKPTILPKGIRRDAELQAKCLA